jgi:protein SCO1/2
VTTLDHSTSEEDIAATIERVRQAPERRDELVALLPENAPLYERRSSAEVTRLRGYLLAAFADTGLPGTALPYVLEALESGHMPYEVAGAAIGLRGIDGPAADVVPYLLRAVRNLSGAGATVSFERYDPRWPYAQPTTALTEVLRTLAGLGAEAATALPELERLVVQRERYPEPVLEAMQAAREAIATAQDTCGCSGEPALARRATHSCCNDMAQIEPFEEHLAGALVSTRDVELEDQDGRAERFAGFFSGKPCVVAFFYTRCDNPYKCSLTVTRLAQVQELMRERGLGGALRLAAVTYDPEFDIPKRLKLYGTDRGVIFGDDARFFRTTSGFSQLSRYFRLQVNYGSSTVNRHQIEVYLLDSRGEVASSFTRLQWEPAEVLAAAEALLATVS